MDPVNLAQDVGRWAAREMGCPAALLPPEPALRRMCMGPMADVWTFLIQKIHSQRTVKKIRGNLLWYNHQESPEAGRRRELEAALMRVQAEIREMDLSLELAEREAVAQDVALELTLKQIRDAQGKALLLRARAAAARRQQRGLRDRTQRLQGQLSHLQDMARKAKAHVAFQPRTPMLLGLEPDVLQEVMRVCTLRTQFFQALLTPHSDPRTLTTQDDLFATTHRQWFSEMEVLMASHPPEHILGALEHLASRQTTELQLLTDEWDGEARRLQLAEASEAPVLPSLTHLIQEGWQAVGLLISQRGPLLRQGQALAARLQDLTQEVTQRAPGLSHALTLGLQAAALRATRDSLKAQSQTLKEEAERRQQELWELQAKRQRILSWRQQVEQTQERIRVLIKGNSVSKSHLQKSPGEIQALAQRKVVPAAEAVRLQAQNLLSRQEEETQWLLGLELNPLLRHHPGGAQSLPSVFPSVYSLHPACPRSQSLIHLSQDLGLPSGKAPEFLLHQAASLRQDWLFLQDQLSHRVGMLRRLQKNLPPGPSTQGERRGRQGSCQPLSIMGSLLCAWHWPGEAFYPGQRPSCLGSPGPGSGWALLLLRSLWLMQQTFVSPLCIRHEGYIGHRSCLQKAPDYEATRAETRQVEGMRNGQGQGDGGGSLLEAVPGAIGESGLGRRNGGAVPGTSCSASCCVKCRGVTLGECNKNS